MKNKTATEYWNILRSDLDSAIHLNVPMEKQRKRSKRNICENRLFRKIKYVNRLCGRYTSILELIMITKYTKRH